ncbi:reverse transcriptase domain-containing protein [Tanacetum coccineum]
MTSGLVVDLQVVWVVIDAKAPWDSCSEDRKTRLAAFKLEGMPLSCESTLCYTGWRSMLFADTCTWVAFHEIFLQQLVFRHLNCNVISVSIGSICQQDRENSGSTWRGLRLPPVTFGVLHEKTEIRISRIEMVIGFRTGDRANRRTRVVMTRDFRGQDQRFAGRNGNDRQGQGNYNQRQHRGQSTRDFNQGHASGSAGQRRSTETLPPPPLCTTCGKPHPGVCYKATGGCFTCGSTQHKVKDCPQGKQKQSMPADFARLPPTTGWVYATTRDQAAKTSGTITGILYIDDRTVFVLFDTGATHSIISTTFAKKLNMTPTPLIERVIISTPMKNHMLIDHEYVNCPLRFDDRSERSVYRECLENGFIRPSVSPLGCIDLICLEVREEHALNGIIMDPSKMKLHQNGGRDLLWWTDCESFFWGLLAINRRYVEGDFGGIERRLVSDPILTLPSGLVVFQDIYSDASKKCLDVELCDDVLVAIGARNVEDGNILSSVLMMTALFALKIAMRS